MKKRARLKEDYFFGLHAQGSCTIGHKTTKAMPGIAFVTFAVGPAGQPEPKEIHHRCVWRCIKRRAGALVVKLPGQQRPTKYAGSMVSPG